MKKYIVTWCHVFGGNNSEDVFAVSKAEAKEKVMRKYDGNYVFHSVRVV